MSAAARFPFVSRGVKGPVSDLAPVLPITLARNGVSVGVEALADTGATVSVLPWSISARFGVDWDYLNVVCDVGGGLGHLSGKIIALDVVIGSFAPVQLACSWVKSDAVPVILGQTSFFLAFDACFLRSRGYFEIQPASAATP